jgi:ubiquinone/menaquinone biosynthesis C-methylase UbiE
MNKWSPSNTYLRVAEANRCFYSQMAALYDATETCVRSKRHQAMLEADLDRILEICGKPKEEIKVLDACGGSGNVSLKLLRRGIQPVLADISPELVEIFRKKCESNAFKPETVCKEIGAYLAEEGELFDLIIFSSALHHLENIKPVLALAFHRLEPEGVLFTVFDPASRNRLRLITRVLKRIDYYFFKIFAQSSDLPRAIGRRLRRTLAGVSPSNKAGVALSLATCGLLAEYHVEQGIDDLDLAAYLRQVGFEVVSHDRHALARYVWIEHIIRWLGNPTAFKLILRKPDNRGAG